MLYFSGEMQFNFWIYDQGGRGGGSIKIYCCTICKIDNFRIMYLKIFKWVFD